MRLIPMFVLAAATALAQPAAAPKKAATPAAPVSMARSAKDLKYPPLKQLKLPDIAEFKLSNGMRVFLVENHELPLVRGYTLIRTGNIFDPADKVGLSDIYSDTMRSGGTAQRTPDQVNELLESIAASVESSIGETSGSVSFNTLAEHTDTVLAVFRDFLVEPAFRQDKVDLSLERMRGALLRRNDQPGAVASREFSRLLYGPQTPWGRQTEIEHLDRIKRDDLVAFHKRYFFQENILLAIQGDFKTDEMKAKLEKLFANWTPKQPPVPALPPVDAQPKPGIYVAERPEVNQTTFRIGHLGGLMKDKDYPALDVMSDILGGGGFSSRLMQKVRSDLGLAYGVSANWSADFDHPGTFTIGGSTKVESTVDAIKVILDEVNRIRTTEVTDEELRIAKDTILNSFVFRFDTPGKVLNQMVLYDYYGYPRDFIYQYQKAVAAVTKADVLRVAKQYIQPDKFVFVAATKSSDLKTPLTALNLPMSKIDLTIPQPKAAEVKADAQSLARGKQMIQAMQKAVGGADKLAAVQDYTISGQVTVAAMQGAKITQTSQYVGNHVRLEQVLPFGKIIVYSDGQGGGWLSSPQGMVPLPPQFAKQAQDEIFRQHTSLWLSDRNPDRTVNATGPNSFEIRDKNGSQIQLTLGSDGLPAKASYRSADGQAVEATYSDFKEAGGLKLPHAVKIVQNGKPAAEVVVSEYKLSSGLKAEDLAKKP